MIYLKLFEEFRNSKGDLPFEEIDKENFKKLLRENCKDFISLARNLKYSFQENENRLLFRKFKNYIGDFTYSYPSKSEHVRIAPWANSNWHNLIISNLDSWKEYPRRNKSLICASIRRAYGHEGNYLYLIIPYDKTKLGVCKSNDFWESFRSYYNPNGHRRYISDWFLEVLRIISLVSDGFNVSDEDDYNKILPFLDKKYSRGLFKNLFDDYNEDKTLLDNLNIYLNPSYNNFQLLTFKDVSPLLSNEKECWFEDECLMIRWKTLLELSKEEIEELFS